MTKTTVREFGDLIVAYNKETGSLSFYDMIDRASVTKHIDAGGQICAIADFLYDIADMPEEKR